MRVSATSAGPHGGEVLAGLSVAVHAEVPTERLLQMIYAYPTFHRAIENALHPAEVRKKMMPKAAIVVLADTESHADLG